MAARGPASPRSGDDIDAQTLRQAGADYAHAARTGELGGAGAELNAEYGLPADHSGAPGAVDGPGVLVPYEVSTAMAQRASSTSQDQRAVSVVANLPGPQNTGPIMTPLVPRMAMEFLGLRPDLIPFGTARRRRLSAWPVGEYKTENQEATEQAAIVREADFTPRRADAIVSVSQEAVRTNDPGLGGDVIGWCRMALDIKLDATLLAGSGDAPEFRGIANPVDAPDAEADALTYASALDLGAQVDGFRAATAADVKLLVNPETYNRLLTLRGAGNAADYSALQGLAEMGVMVRASAHMPAGAAVSGHDNNSLVLTRLGMDRADYDFPMWDAIRVSLLATSLGTLGRLVWAGQMFHDFALPADDTGRSGGFPLRYVKTA